MPLLKTLPDNLVLRTARPEDAAPLAEFNAKWLSDDGPEKPEEPLAVWTRDVFSRPHPTFSPELATIVEDTNTGEIVSSIMLFPQTWSYDGIPFGVGRPELVATHPDFRRRGLIRLQMDTVHAWSTAMGDRMQAITGIPWFYRQFGYEMGLENSGGRIAYRGTIPALKKDVEEKVAFRAATPDDIPFLMETYTHNAARHRVACVRDAAMWTYELEGRTKGNLVRLEVRIIENEDGTPIGYIGHPDQLWNKVMAVTFAGLAPGASWLDVAPPLARYLLRIGETFAAEKEDADCEGAYFCLGADHPAYALFPTMLTRVRNPYAWYIRIPDLPGFIDMIAPALEKRLAASELAGYSGATTVGFYRSGFKLVFKDGSLAPCEAWMPEPDKEGDVRFPDLTFLSLLCGRKTFRQLSEFFPDCFATGDTHAALMEALFPRQPSNVWGVV